MTKKDYSHFMNPEFAGIFDSWLEHITEQIQRQDKLIKELEEAPEQLDLFKQKLDE